MMTTLKTALRATGATCTRLAEKATCHHAAYGVLATFYAASLLQLCDKDLVTQAAMTIYFTLALRPGH